MDIRIAISFIMLSMTVYFFTGFVIVAVQNLKRAYWIKKKMRRPRLKFFGKNSKVKKEKFLVSLENGNVEIREFDYSTYYFEGDKEVVAWRYIPLPYKSYGNKLISRFKKLTQKR